MRAGRLFLLGIKWLVVPAALAAAGYYYIGPELGAPRLDPVATNDPSQPTIPVAEKKPKRTSGEPQVEVSVRKGQPAPRRSTRPRRSSSSRTTDRTTAPVRIPTTDG